MLLLLALCAAPADAQEASVAEPRAFGYLLGDRIERDVLVTVPAGLVLDEASLPRTGQRGPALELQQLRRQALGGGRLSLHFVYQLMRSPAQTEVLEIAPITLRFTGEAAKRELRIDAWPVTVSPLTPADPSPRTGLGELRPDQPPPPLDTQPVRRRLALEAGVALLLLGWLAYVWLLLPWWARRHRPFGRAWLALRAAPGRHAAFQHLHQALNATAGEVLFTEGIERFLGAHPRFRNFNIELQEFFERSRQEFFGGAGAPDGERWLLDLCRKLRDAELR
ncbi:hypothetical protein [Pelomonas sp. KK5]|uniref:hypothetical protein n=1 Tax=Pelomonas sp. KK5 TaxID=1855730 RepID=UPI00097C58AF|nr:hypothetical protein [Pelomonas sp. KK5]